MSTRLLAPSLFPLGVAMSVLSGLAALAHIVLAGAMCVQAQGVSMPNLSMPDLPLPLTDVPSRAVSGLQREGPRDEA